MNNPEGKQPNSMLADWDYKALAFLYLFLPLIFGCRKDLEFTIRKRHSLQSCKVFSTKPRLNYTQLFLLRKHHVSIGLKKVCTVLSHLYWETIHVILWTIIKIHQPFGKISCMNLWRIAVQTWNELKIIMFKFRGDYWLKYARIRDFTYPYSLV